MRYFQGLLSDGKTLFLRNVNFHNSGSYSCEVVADSTFLTLIKSAHMQVVGEMLNQNMESEKEAECDNLLFQTMFYVPDRVNTFKILIVDYSSDGKPFVDCYIGTCPYMYVL